MNIQIIIFPKEYPSTHLICSICETKRVLGYFRAEGNLDNYNTEYYDFCSEECKTIIMFQLS